MITSLADFLEQLQAREASLLAREQVSHGPTIGDMYEGLTRKLLKRTIPSELNLRFVQGFVLGVDGSRSHQTDAMLVMGDRGRQLPHTESWEWPIQDVLAVFEVKKNLYGAELVDSLRKMASVSLQQKMYLAQNFQVHLGPSRAAFAQVTGREPRAREEYDLESPEAEIYRTISHEQLAPIRVVFGYEGYADEYGLRKGFLDTLMSVADSASPALLPNIIICRSNALIKLSGHPYIIPMYDDGYWEVFGSMRTTPYLPLIELLWARLSNQFGGRFPVDDQLEVEAITPLLSGRQVVEGDRRGWMYHSTELSRSQLAKTTAGNEWNPLEITTGEATLCDIALAVSGFALDDPDLMDQAQQASVDLPALVDKLVENRVVCWRSPRYAVPISDGYQTLRTPDGRAWIAMNAKLMTLWASKYGFAPIPE